MVEVFAGWLSPTANPPVGCVNGMLGRVSLGETSNCVERQKPTRRGFRRDLSFDLRQGVRSRPLLSLSCRMSRATQRNPPRVTSQVLTLAVIELCGCVSTLRKW